jgi:hypothetical protein
MGVCKYVWVLYPGLYVWEETRLISISFIERAFPAEADAVVFRLA